MLPPEQRAYSPEEFRRLLDRLFGPAPDWDLAGMAAPHFFTTQRTVYRWMTGTKPIAGPAARVTFDLEKRGRRGA